MVLTADIHLPEESELTVPEINLSGSTLYAGSFHLGKYCEYANNVSKYYLSFSIRLRSLKTVRDHYYSLKFLIN